MSTLARCSFAPLRGAHELLIIRMYMYVCFSRMESSEALFMRCLSYAFSKVGKAEIVLENSSEPYNYRLISLLSIKNKVLELSNIRNVRTCPPAAN